MSYIFIVRILIEFLLKWYKNISKKDRKETLNYKTRKIHTIHFENLSQIIVFLLVYK